MRASNGIGSPSGGNQPEMAFGQHEIRILGHGAETGKIGQMARHRRLEHGAVAQPRDPVEDDPGKRQRRIVPGEPGDQRRRRGALMARVDDEHDGPPGEPGEFGGRARFAIGSGAVEEPHHPFAQHE